MPNTLADAMLAADSASQPQRGPMASAIQPQRQPFNRNEEMAFQQWVRALPWFGEFKQQYGEEPNLSDPDYDYRAAWKAGLTPQRYAPDGGKYHWPSASPDGSMLKSKNHPTAWMEDFMRATGVDPNTMGVRDEAEGRRIMQQRLNQR